MNPSTSLQTIANVCLGSAALIFLLPLQKLLWDYAHAKRATDGWETPTLIIVILLWLALLGALLCVTASGGFDWLRLGRPALHTLTVAATVALAAASFVSIALFMRPGFIPPILFCPIIYLIPLVTMLVIILSLNPQLAPGISPQFVRLPWTIFATVCLIVSVGFGGYQLVRWSVNTVGITIARQINKGPASPEILAKIATLDPQKDFADLLKLANRHQSTEVREAATARLRLHPKFLETLIAELKTGQVEPAVEFLHSATLSPTEKARLAGPAFKAMDRWTESIPAANYTTKDNTKKLNRWGTEMFQVLGKEFAGTGPDFTPVFDYFKEKVEAPRH